MRDTNKEKGTSMEKLLQLVRVAMWSNDTAVADYTDYEEMRKHAIATLPAHNFSLLEMTPDLKKEWSQYALQNLVHYTRYEYEQSHLNISVPYVILKGSSAAQYYPCPEYRMMGDIDIMTRREDFDAALSQLQNNGYRIVKEENREIGLIKNGIIVELHRRFASLNNPDQAKYLDDLIIQHINPSHILPDIINGLILLEHISQHLENGLGLRQIIDWMMFVDKCLPDEKWPEFRQMANRIGLENLAVVTTKMCVKNLGLLPHKWCEKANDELCEQLMTYVLSCGDFGNKRTSDADISENAFSYATTPKMAFRLLQKQGSVNWVAAQKHEWLRHFAWIYQIFRYAIKGLNRKSPFKQMLTEYNAAKNRNKMLKELGVKIYAEGIAVYKDGKYVKE